MASEDVKNTVAAVGETPALDQAVEDVKGKGKAKAVESTDEEEDEEDSDNEEVDEDDVEDDDFAEIDPSSILPSSRRSTRAQVDYSSAEALKKAGLQEGDDDEENEGDRDVTFDASMQTDDE